MTWDFTKRATRCSGEWPSSSSRSERMCQRTVGHHDSVTHVAEPKTPWDEQRSRRIPGWVWLVVSCLLLPVLALGGYWINYKKPWLMDDFRAGYAYGADTELDAKRPDDPCGDAMAEIYDLEPGYDQFITPEDASAFYLGCNRGWHGASNDWWNVSGYLTA